MAHMRHFRASVSVNNSCLPIYGVQLNHTEKIITFCVPAKENQSFTLHWQSFTNLPLPSCGDVTIDGVRIGGMTLHPRPLGHTHRRVSSRAEMSFNEDPDKLFKFGRCDLPITSDSEDTKAGDGKTFHFTAHCRGEIRLDIYLILEISQSEADHPDFKCVLINDPKDSLLGARWKYRKDAPLNRTERIVSFIIKYRSEDMLQQMTLTQDFGDLHLSMMPKHELGNHATSSQNETVVVRPSRKRKRPDNSEVSELKPVDTATDDMDEESLMMEIAETKKRLKMLRGKVRECTTAKRKRVVVAHGQVLSLPPGLPSPTGHTVSKKKKKAKKNHKKTTPAPVLASEIMELEREANEAEELDVKGVV